MKILPTNQKLLGAYYTPADVAEFVANWAIQGKQCEVLEPSCGDGSFLKAAAKRLMNLGSDRTHLFRHISAVEVELVEAEKASKCLSDGEVVRQKVNVHIGDFFAFCSEKLNSTKRYDAIIGNPPFIKYQSFVEEQRTLAFQIMRGVGLHPNRLTNAWLPFLIGSSLLLSDNGRLGMVIPAELFQVHYAAETRKFLSDFFQRITIITFRKLIFEGVQQEVVLLLCEKGVGEAAGIRTIQLNTPDDLRDFHDNPLPVTELIKLDHSTEKWTKYFLSASEVSLLRELKLNPQIARLGDYADVNVGVVTGQNDFFILGEEEVHDKGLGENVERIVTRSAHLEGLSFGVKDWKGLCRAGLPAYLFYPDNVPFEELPTDIQDFISGGETANLHKGYKCSIRKRWYIVPSVAVPDGFMLRQVHSYPKLVLNTSKATSTDTIHRVYFKNGCNRKAVVSSFVNSMTFAFSEITGRSYGGGVLTFEPSEAAILPISIEGADQLDLKEMDSLIRTGNIKATLDHTDHALLVNGLGLAKKDVATLRGIWIKLRDRRNARKFE